MKHNKIIQRLCVDKYSLAKQTQPQGTNHAHAQRESFLLSPSDPQGKLKINYQPRMP